MRYQYITVSNKEDANAAAEYLESLGVSKPIAVEDMYSENSTCCVRCVEYNYYWFSKLDVKVYFDDDERVIL